MYRVVSECIDLRTGERLQPGDALPDPTPEMVETLTRAGCIEKVETPKPQGTKSKPRK